jgi:flagellar basal-body rod modification protein FlgD
MSIINATTSTTGAGATAPAKNPGILDKDGFLKLLVGQMKNQDPMDPKGSMDISQMAQMSMVEQLTSLAGTTKSLLDQSRMSSVLGLVGKTVTYTDDNDASVTGLVSRVSTAGGVPSISVNGVDGISPDKIAEVS